LSSGIGSNGERTYKGLYGAGGATPRSESDEAYVIDLCDEILRERGLRQHRFRGCSGIPAVTAPGQAASRCLLLGPSNRRRVRERQHTGGVPSFDLSVTVSGMSRGEQQRRYDELRDREIPKHGLMLVVVTPDDRAATGRTPSSGP
jgi:hypothetical protein